MKKAVLWLWVVLFVAVQYLCSAVCWICREMAAEVKPVIGVVTFIKAIGFMCVGVAGIGMVGVFMAVMK